VIRSARFRPVAAASDLYHYFHEPKFTKSGDPIVVGSFSGKLKVGSKLLSSAGDTDMLIMRLAK
jgi:hypothetical protein